MKLDKARRIAQHCNKARDIAGAQVDYPYDKFDLADALIALELELAKDPIPREEHNKVIRQLTAANARLAKYEKQPGNRS